MALVGTIGSARYLSVAIAANGRCFTKTTIADCASDGFGKDLSIAIAAMIGNPLQ